MGRPRLALVAVVPLVLAATQARAQTAPGAPDQAPPTPTPPPPEAPPSAPSPPAQPPPAAAVPEPTTPLPPGPPSLVSGTWKTHVYGFVELDVAHDSTQAFNDLGGQLSTAIPKDYNYAGSRDRTQATARNSRLGLVVNPPVFAGIASTLTLEGDFMGNQPNDSSESAFVTSPTFRLRIAAVQFNSDILDVLAGQGWELFGFQPFFFPASDFLQPIPGGVLKRDLQIQLTHTFRSRPIDVQIGASANRPPQRDSATPDVQAALRLFFNGWRGVHTPGTDGQRIVGSAVDPLAVAVSASGRRFRVSDFEPTPAGTSPDPHFSNSANGYAIAADALIPVIPVESPDDRRNGLTLTGELTTGTGYADLLGGLVSNGGGPATPAANYPMVPGSPDPYVPNIQSGLVTYDNGGGLHTIDWTTFVVGAQYYLPFAAGKVFVSGNYAEARSGNVASWADPGQRPFIFTKTQYYDANLFWDIAASVRAVASYEFYRQTFDDGEAASNVRMLLSGYFWF
jgi:hypothetical protein